MSKVKEVRLYFDKEQLFNEESENIGIEVDTLVASLMLANGVPMKQIQEWLGHADFGTTANIYSHLDYTTKQNSANTISNVFSFLETNQPQQEIKQEQDKETNQQELLDEIERLKQMIKEKEEDEEYLTWQREREEKRKKKQSDMEM